LRALKATFILSQWATAKEVTKAHANGDRRPI
jgi:hypothetical protein